MRRGRIHRNDWEKSQMVVRRRDYLLFLLYELGHGRDLNSLPVPGYMHRPKPELTQGLIALSDVRRH